MQASAITIYAGENAKVGEFLVNRLLPARNAAAVGRMVFLDHVLERNPFSLVDPVERRSAFFDRDRFFYFGRGED